MDRLMYAAMTVLAAVAVGACVHAALGGPAHRNIASGWPLAVHATAAAGAIPTATVAEGPRGQDAAKPRL
jgi:hypothetical protein